MSYFFIKNHRDQSAGKLGEHPSTLSRPLPPFENKEAMRAWSKHETTDHVFFSLTEGMTPACRVTNWQGTNPPFKLYGMVGDYDGQVDRSVVKAICARHEDWIRPTWITRTWSGGMRAVWEFEEPAVIDNEALAKLFLDKFKVKLRMLKLVHDGEFDEKSLDPSTYFELGTEWEQLSEPVARDTVQATLYEAAAGLLNKDLKADAPDIPLDAIAAEVEKRWPGRWPGKFEAGARGPLFWLDDGVDRVGCQVGDYGIICYSSRANTSFMSWLDLLGPEFVRQYQEKKIGSIMDGLYFDGRSYWAKGERGWSDYTTELATLLLKKRGLSGKRIKGSTLTDIEEAILAICTTNRVDAACPLIFNKRERVNIGGLRYLNTSTLKAMPPVECDNVEERCPWLWSFMTNFFDPVEQDGHLPHEYFLAWWKRGYMSALSQEHGMDQGHGIVIAGLPNTGKTFLSHVILGQSFGGSVADASAAMSQPGAFNKEMGESAIWAIDDNLGSANFDSHRRSTEMFKRTVANPYVLHHAKHKDAKTIPWCGRIVHTTNLDAESFRAVPDSEGSILDKVMYFMCNSNGWKPQFSDNNKVNEDRVKTELPFFLGWLSAWEVPPALIDMDNRRYGIKAYHHPKMLQEVRNANSDHRFIEVLDLWRQRYREENPGVEEWTGSCAMLKSAIEAFPEMRGLMHHYHVINLGHILSRLEQQKTLVSGCRILNGIKRYKIRLTA